MQREHLSVLYRSPIPIAGIEAPVVLDGEGFRLRFYAQTLGVEVRWWDDGTAEWKTFIAAVLRLYDDLAGRFDQCWKPVRSQRRHELDHRIHMSKFAAPKGLGR